MISGVDLGNKEMMTAQVEVQASSNKGGKLEIWLDDLKNGQLIATIPVTGSGVFSSKIRNVWGHHDVFVKFPAGKARDIHITNIRFK